MKTETPSEREDRLSLNCYEVGDWRLCYKKFTLDDAMSEQGTDSKRSNRYATLCKHCGFYHFLEGDKYHISPAPVGHWVTHTICGF